MSNRKQPLPNLESIFQVDYNFIEVKKMGIDFHRFVNISTYVSKPLKQTVRITKLYLFKMAAATKHFRPVRPPNRCCILFFKIQVWQRSCWSYLWWRPWVESIYLNILGWNFITQLALENIYEWIALLCLLQKSLLMLEIEMFLWILHEFPLFFCR